MLLIIVVLLGVGAVDMLIVQAAARDRSGLVGALFTPFAVLGGFVLAAAAFWWLQLGGNVHMPGENLEQTNARAVATVIAVLLGSVIVSILSISRLARQSPTTQPIDHH